mmetsp:Transcript_102977/g.322166  ORF Transcript_102977/g.322166 Transcript_102977/m.322166 type:complete len:637 (+) Transcript_102977:88-1998(+)
MVAAPGELERELFLRIAPLQPELAPRLAQRLALLPRTQVSSILDSKAALVRAIDQALAQELNEQDLTFSLGPGPAAATPPQQAHDAVVHRLSAAEVPFDMWVQDPDAIATAGSAEVAPAALQSLYPQSPCCSLPSSAVLAGVGREAVPAGSQMLHSPSLRCRPLPSAVLVDVAKEAASAVTQPAQPPSPPSSPRAGAASPGVGKEAPQPLYPSTSSSLPSTTAPTQRRRVAAAIPGNDLRLGSASTCSGSRGSREESDSSALQLVSRVAQLQPEMALRIVEKIFDLGANAVHECMDSDWVLQHRVQEVLASLFREEASAESEDSHFFRAGPGHRLPGKTPHRSEASPKRPAIPVPVSTCRPVAVEALAETRSCSSRSPGSGLDSLYQTPASKASTPNGHPGSGLDSPLQTQASRASTSASRPGSCIESLPQSPGSRASTSASRPGLAPSGTRVWGLEDFLAELSLSEYAAPAAVWAASMGAAFLEEVVENQEDLAEALQLRPLERRRLERQGGEVAARLAQWRPREVVPSTVVSAGAKCWDEGPATPQRCVPKAAWHLAGQVARSDDGSASPQREVPTTTWHQAQARVRTPATLVAPGPRAVVHMAAWQAEAPAPEPPSVPVTGLWRQPQVPPLYQ